MQLEYKLSNRAGIPLMRLQGRFDAKTAAFLKSQIDNLVNKQQPNLVIDLSGVSFIDSLGLAALVSGLKLCRKNQGVLKLFGLQPLPRLLFETTHLDQIFQPYEDEDNTFASFNLGQ